MKNKLFPIIFIFALCSSIVSEAQTNRSYKKGYRGMVELENYATFGKDKVGGLFQISTTHGYSLGNGVFIGAGIGCGYGIASDQYLVSAFIDSKYTLFDTTVSPFVSARTGFCLGTERNNLFGQMVSISFGIDVNRLSVKIGYQYCPMKEQVVLDGVARQSTTTVFTKLNQVFCTFAFNF